MVLSCAEADIARAVFHFSFSNFLEMIGLGAPPCKLGITFLAELVFFVSCPQIFSPNEKRMGALPPAFSY